MLVYYFLDTHLFRKGLAESFGYLREQPSSSKMGQFRAARERRGLTRTHIPSTDLGDNVHRFYKLASILVVLLIATSCAAGTQGASERAPSSRDPITMEEMQSAQSLTNGYELVQRFRPRWLRARGRSSMSSSAPVVVFVDNVHFGGIETLYNISTERINEIRYFDAADATSRWGTGFSGGVIEVLTGGL